MRLLLISFITLISFCAFAQESNSSGGVIDFKERTISFKKKDKKVKHIVKWYECLEDLEKRYGVPADAIIEYNNLKTSILYKKQVLYIPPEEYVTLFNMSKAKQVNKELEKSTPIENIEKKDVKDELVNTSKEENIELFSSTDNVNFAVILPLNITDTIAPSANFTDFYSGVLMAIEEQKRKGLNIEISLIDQTQYLDISTIPNLEIYKRANFIIGPVRGADITKISNNLDNKFLISPLDPNTESLTIENERIIYAPASNNSQIENIVNSVYRDYIANPESSLLLINESFNEEALVKSVKEALIKKGLEFKQLSYSILEGREIIKQLYPAIKEDNNNIVIVASTNEAFVTDAIRNLNLALSPNKALKAINNNNIANNDLAKKENNKITLYGLPKWRNFNGIEPNYLHAMNLHLALPYYVDYNSINTSKFIYRYRILFSAEPSPFAYQGYDIANYFIEQYSKYGENLYKKNALDSSNNSLQANFNFVKKESGNGLINTATIEIIYNPDFTISIIK